jgi:hypothetical protein
MRKKTIDLTLHTVKLPKPKRKLKGKWTLTQPRKSKAHYNQKALASTLKGTWLIASDGKPYCICQHRIKKIKAVYIDGRLNESRQTFYVK